MGHTGPSQVVSAPMAAQPIYGLRRSAAKPSRDELLGPSGMADATTPGTGPASRARPYWTNGITYEPEGCQKGQTLDPCDPATTTYPDHPAVVEWFPYGLQVTEKCSTFSYRDDRIARINRLMEMDTERQLGHELWTGAVAETHDLTAPGAPWPNTWLADPSSVEELSAGALTPEDALGCLESYLNSHNGGQQGMIHATPHAAVHWFKSYLVMRDPADGLLKTPLGTIVVVSPGYPGTDPEGATGTGNVWAYATDMVRVWLDAVEPYDLEHTIDRAQNTVQTQADRMGLAEWQRCRHAGVQINITPCIGEVS